MSDTSDPHETHRLDELDRETTLPVTANTAQPKTDEVLVGTDNGDTGLNLDGPVMEPVPAVPTVTLTAKQEIGRKLFVAWFMQQMRERDELKSKYVPKIFRIFGYAGVGKTFFTKYVVEEVRRLMQEELNKVLRVRSGAFSGKAALVMNRNGMPGSNTIHSEIYKVVVPSKEEYQELQKKLQALPEGEERKKVDAEMVKAKTVGFELNEDENAPLRNADLYILDECSMVNQEMLNDILTFKVPILVLGDPGQLPPVAGTGALMEAKPDIFLDEVMRQAADNPIIQLSMIARNGGFLARKEYGTKAKHISTFEVTNAQMKEADQILVGKNTTKATINKRMRTMLGFDDRYPMVGDKLICLKNNKELGIFNGMMVKVLKKLDEYDTTIQYELEDETGRKIVTKVLRIHFDEYFTPGRVKEAPWGEMKDGDQFDFGYAITVHKSQGSQWDNVLLWDDKFFVWDKEQRKKWLYTGITRSVDKLTIVS